MKIEPVVGEVCRFWCGSASNPEGKHLVDLLEHECGCASWVCRRRAYEQATGTPYSCKHLRATREFFLDQILSAIKNK